VCAPAARNLFARKLQAEDRLTWGGAVAALKYFSTGAHYFMRITLAGVSAAAMPGGSDTKDIRIGMVKTPRDPSRGRSVVARTRAPFQVSGGTIYEQA